MRHKRFFLKGEVAFFRERFGLLFKKNHSVFLRQFRLQFGVKISPDSEEIWATVQGKISPVYRGDSGCCSG